jgi:uncharacterized protein YbjT (DUF2867 family)
MTIQQQPGPVLVIGAGGKTGARVADGLMARGVAVRRASRSGPTPFDWTAPGSWDGALIGAHAAYISYYPDLAVAGARQIVGRLIDRALAHGVRRLVLLSGRGEEEAMRTERLLQDSGADWTILRASWFAQNFSESFLLDGVRAGEILLPATSGIARVQEPFLDIDDLAEAAVASLCEPGHVHRLYEVTGPRGLTFFEAAEALSQTVGQPVRITLVPPEAYRDGALAQGVPSEIVDLILYLFGTILDGRNSAPADGIFQALGRAPTDFQTYLAKTATSGIWQARAA